MTRPRTIVSIVGARPQFVKLAPMVKAFECSSGIKHSVIHTGQHYDEKMSKSFFELLGLPEPDINLGIGSGTHGAQTGAMMTSLEACFTARKPDGILVYGDTNSTLAATLAAVKMHIPVAHIEAGLRSFNRHMPEEINRIATDHCCDRLYAPTPLAIDNLKQENLHSRACLSGDVMRDAVKQFHNVAKRKSTLLGDLNLEPGCYALLTLHRPVNTSREALNELIPALQDIASSHLPLLFPVHPRTRAVLEDNHIKNEAILYHDPLDYFDMLTMVDSARFVITDSGGLQKEAAFLQTPCITLREETEWPELVDIGVNRLVGTQHDFIRQAFNELCNDGYQPFDSVTQQSLDDLYGSGNAAELIVDDLVKCFDLQ